MLVFGAVLGTACSARDYAGEYNGTATIDVTVQRWTVANQAATTHTQTTKEVDVSIVNISDDVFVVKLPDGCRLSVKRAPAPNRHLGMVAEGQRCAVPVNGYNEPAEFTGNLQFRSTEPQLDQLYLSGALRQGTPGQVGAITGTYTYTINAAKRKGA